MEEYEYLENLNSEELAKIIDQMLDFEETTKALMILEEKDSQKALELGKDIIKNNKGDDYLQATVWNVFFFDNQKDMIDVQKLLALLLGIYQKGVVKEVILGYEPADDDMMILRVARKQIEMLNENVFNSRWACSVYNFAKHMKL